MYADAQGKPSKWYDKTNMGYILKVHSSKEDSFLIYVITLFQPFVVLCFIMKWVPSSPFRRLDTAMKEFSLLWFCASMLIICGLFSDLVFSRRSISSDGVFMQLPLGFTLCFTLIILFRSSDFFTCIYDFNYAFLFSLVTASILPTLLFAIQYPMDFVIILFNSPIVFAVIIISMIPFPTNVLIFVSYGLIGYLLDTVNASDVGRNLLLAGLIIVLQVWFKRAEDAGWTKIKRVISEQVSDLFALQTAAIEHRKIS